VSIRQSVIAFQDISWNLLNIYNVYLKYTEVVC